MLYQKRMAYNEEMENGKAPDGYFFHKTCRNKSS